LIFGHHHEDRRGHRRPLDGIRRARCGNGWRNRRSAMKPFFVGKDPLYREKHWQDFRTYDRWVATRSDIFLRAFDIWSLRYRRPAGRTAAVPAAGRVPGQSPGICQLVRLNHARSLCPAGPRSEKAAAGMLINCIRRGKLDFDLAALPRVPAKQSARISKLMADPVAAYSHEQAFRVGRELERLNYYWLEEPLFDVDFHGLRKLTAKLDIPNLRGRKSSRDRTTRLRNRSPAAWWISCGAMFS